MNTPVVFRDNSAEPDTCRVPALFLTMDDHADMTLHCLRSYAALWPSCPLRFLVPVNGKDGETALRAQLPKGLHVELVRTDPRIVPTLRTLLEAAGEAPWLFFSTSDRYPYAAAPPERLNGVARAVLSNEVGSPEIAAIRMTRWYDIHNWDGGEEEVGGVRFQTASIGGWGAWHHQFVRTEILAEFFNSLDDALTLGGFHDQYMKYLERSALKGLIPEQSLLKFEEPMVGGQRTLNYALRQMREGQDVDAASVALLTRSYSSPVAACYNTAWTVDGTEAKDVLNDPPPSTPIFVVSSGGVGSKMVVKWLLPEAARPERSMARLVRWLRPQAVRPQAVRPEWAMAHSHRRLPPLSLNPGQKVVYVFGDPRNAVVSIFNRRHGRSELHDFTASPTGKAASDFALRHAANIMAHPFPANENWGLSEFLKEGSDFFRFEEHFDFWFYGQLSYPVLFVRYERLPEVAGLVSQYLQIALEPLSFVPRASNWRDLDPVLQDGVDKIYGSFADRLGKMPDAFVIENGKMRSLLSGEILSPECI